VTSDSPSSRVGVSSGRISAATERRAALCLGGVAAAGVVVAHVLAYALASPDASAHAELLEETGHELWPLTTAAATGAVAAALLGFVSERVQHAQRGFVSERVRRAQRGSPRARLFVHGAPRLALLQSLGFVALEALERLLSGGEVAHLLSEPAVVIGLLLQVGVAVAAVGLLAFLARTIEILIARRSPPSAHRDVPVESLSTRLWAPRFGVAVGGATVRAPPVPS
jgi:hypothetical protein